MSIVSHVQERIRSLVHESAQSSPIERRRHEIFIASRLLGALVAVGLAPVYLAIAGAPELWATLVFGWLMLPLAAVVLVSRTGRLVEAQAICVAALVGLAGTMAIGNPMTSGAALGWLILAPVEAVLSLNIILAVSAGTVALVVAFMIGLIESSGPLASPAPTNLFTNSLIITPAVLYAICLAWSAIRLYDLRHRSERLGAARYLSLTEALGDLVMRHDRSGAVLFASEDSSTLFGLNARELNGRGFFERVHVADRPTFLKGIADALDHHETITTTLRLRTADRTGEAGEMDEPVFVWVEMRARVLHVDGLDDEAAVVTVTRDITARMAHEQHIEDQRLEAERSAAWKDRFLANVSHELRTPLNAIIGFSEMLASEELAPRDPAKRREYAQIINSSGQHLLSVVNSILDMSKIEAGRFDILAEPFDLPPLIDTCCDMMSRKAEQTGIEIVRLYPARMQELMADKRACKQILINLLSNAIKFTPEGGRVTVAARIEGPSISFAVSDTGIGIAASDLPRLGDAFFQARASYDRPFEGTGLGLSVVRGLVGLHGGSISVESEPGVGTCVTVRLPLDCRESSAPANQVARIEAIPRMNRNLFESGAAQHSMVKKIA